MVLILYLSNINMKYCPSCVGSGGLTKYLVLNFIFTGISELTILYLSANLVFNCFDTKKSSSEFIFALHFFKVSFLMIAFTATSLPSPKERSMVFFCRPCNVLCIQPVKLASLLNCYFLCQVQNPSGLGIKYYH